MTSDMASGDPSITPQQLGELIDQLGARLLPMLEQYLGERALPLLVENAQNLIAAADGLKVEGLLATTHSENIDSVIPAMFEARREFSKLTKNRENPHFGSSYADLAQVLEVTSDGLYSYGLYLDQATMYLKWAGQLEMFLCTRIYHVTSMQWLQSWWWVDPDKRNAQGYMSSITYGRRATAQPRLGLAGEDDDGAAASEGRRPRRQEQAPPEPPPAEVTEQERESLIDTIAGLTEVDKVRAMWVELRDDGKLTDELKAHLSARVSAIAEAKKAAPAEQAPAEGEGAADEGGA